MWTQTVVRLLALSLSGGILCGALWDVFKVPRIVLGISETTAVNRLHTVVVFIQDILFCLSCGVVAIVVLYYGNEGNIRGIALVGMSAGFASYRVTFGALTEFCVKKLCGIISRIVLRLLDACKKFDLLVKKLRKEKIKEE